MRTALFSIVFALASLISLSAALSDSRPGPWKILFDGRSVSEWRGFRRSSFPRHIWTVEGGLLKRKKSRGDSRQDLTTRRTFSNFELEFEWRISPGGNSGIKYFVLEKRPRSWERAAYEYRRNELIRQGLRNSKEFKKLSLEEYRYSPIGFEFQILDDSRHPDARNGASHRTGALYDICATTTPANTGPGKFHRGRIVASGDRIQHWVDGVKALEYVRGTVDLRRQIRGSKFAKIPGFGANRSGHITLQDHGDEVAFRSIRIREL